MLDSSLFDSLTSGLIGGGSAVFTCILLLRRSVSELESRLLRLEEERKECQGKCERRFEHGKKEFARLDREIIQGLNEIKIQIAKLEGINEMAKELAQSIKAMAGPGRDRRS